MLNLDRETQTYEANLTDMLKAGEGHYVVIHGESISKMLPSYESAVTWAYENFGLERFLVKQVTAIDPVVCHSRYAGQCAA